MEKVVGGILMGSMLVPMFAFAAQSSSTEQRPRDGSKDICTNLESMRTSALAKATEHSSTRQMKRSDREAKFNAGRTERHMALTTKRTEHDTSRQTHYDALMTRASTTDQKAAVTAFQNEVERLVMVRKAAVDAAIATFEDGAAALQEKADANVLTLSTTVQTDINKLFDDAKASCAAGEKSADVYASLKGAMEANKTAREAEPKTHDLKTEFEALRTTRKAAFEAAHTAFKTGLDAATATLKSSLGKK